MDIMVRGLVMDGGFMVDWSVVMCFSMHVGVDILVRVFSVDYVVLTMLGLISFMDGLRVDVMVIVMVVVVVVVNMVIFVVGFFVVGCFVVGCFVVSKGVMMGTIISVYEWVVVRKLVNSMVAISVVALRFVTVVSTKVSVVSFSLVGMVSFEVTVMAIATEVSVAEVSVLLSVVSPSFDGMTISWSVSVVVIMEVVWLFNVRLIKSVMTVSLSWAESSVSVVFMVSLVSVMSLESVVFWGEPFTVVLIVMLVSVVGHLVVVVSWEVLFTVVLFV